MEDLKLSDEQRKRLDLVEEYEKETAAARAERNEAIKKHDQDFEKKWLLLQPDLELKRAQMIERLRADGMTEQQVQSIVASEMAAAIERHMLEKDAAARKLALASPISWRDWLLEKKKLHPEDPVIDSLIEESKNIPALDGYLKVPPPQGVVSDLNPVPGPDGRVDYLRESKVVLSDFGSRLDVKRTDDRDIEAALKIAAQKFDMDKGLMLTGDLAFKRRAAEIAGRLGYKLQNTEPEVLMAWRKGLEQARAANPEIAVVPSVAPGIEGEVIDRAVAVLKGPMILRADPHTIQTLDTKLVPGVEASTPETVVMPGERYWRAMEEIRELPADVLPIIAQIDIAKEDGGLSLEQIQVLALENQGLVEDGKITQKAIDVVLVRDDRVLKARDSLTPEQIQEFGPVYQTSGDFVREKSGGVDVDKSGPSVDLQSVAAPTSAKKNDQEIGF